MYEDFHERYYAGKKQPGIPRSKSAISTLENITRTKGMMMHSYRVRLTLAAALAALLIPASASAHTGAGAAAGFAYGSLHPIGGLDHILAMVAVGLFAASLGGRALWAVPLTFVGVMALGGFLGIQQVEVPFVELGIALSVVVLGLAIALQLRWPVVAAMGLVGLFAVFHGYAHGAEMPLDSSGLAYAAGFMTATALLHLAGIALGLGVQQAGARIWPRTAQLGGSAIALAGAALLTGAL